MKDEQFNKLIGKLEEIRCGIIDIECDKVMKDDINNIVSGIRTAFFHQLEAKTGWGRNEVKSIFEAAIESAL
jgi:hypothetical protein